MEPLPLDDVWVDLTILRPQDAYDIRAGGSLREVLDLHYEQRRWRATALESLTDRLSGSAALVGPPGCGKTTLLKWIARRLVLEAGGRYLLPLFVPLRSFGGWRRTHRDEGLLDYALARAGVTDASQRRAWAGLLGEPSDGGDGPVLVLLDGWDEVREEDRDALREEIEGLLRSFAVILTSRPSGFPRYLPIEEFYEILELSPESVDLLIERWFRHTGAPEGATTLRRHLERRHDLRRMARNPFLLSLLCGISLRAGLGRQELPASRSDLYRQATELIYSHHNQRYPNARLDRARQHQVERLALWLLDEAQESPRYVFGLNDVLDCGHSAAFLEEHLKPTRLLSQWSPAEDTYHFLHTTFHEYLAARALRREPPDSALRRLRRRINNLAWQEVFLFLAGQSPAAAEQIWSELAHLAAHPDCFGHVFLRLAGLVAEAGYLDGGREALGIDVREPLWTGILSFTINEPFIDAYASVDVRGLAQRTAAALPTSDARTRVRLLQALARSQAVETSHVLVDQILGGSQPDARVALNQLLMYGRIDDEDRERLRRVAFASRTRSETRRRAIRALGSIRDVLSVQRLGQVGRRSRAIGEEVTLALAWIGGEDAARVLGEMLRWSDDANWQRHVVFALGEIHAPLARDLLLDLLATREAHRDLRIFILGALAEKPIHRGVDLIVTVLQSASLPTVRAQAAEALTQANGPGVREALLAAARSDPDEEVRTEALKALERHGRAADVPWFAERARLRSLGAAERANALWALLHTVLRYSGTTEGPGLASVAAAEVLWALEEPAGEIARAAALLAYIAGVAVGARLAEICLDESVDLDIRSPCCLSLGRLRFKPAVPVLLDLVRRSPDIDDDEELPPYQWGQKLSWEAAQALTRIDPGALLNEPGTASGFALAKFALETGSLVFGDVILGSDGREIARRSSRLSGPASCADPPPLTRRPRPGIPEADLEIVIHLEAALPAVTFKLTARDPHLYLDGTEFGPVRLGRRLQDYSCDLIRDVESIGSRRRRGGSVGRTLLAAKGATLFRTLLPERLQWLLWELQERVETVQLFSDEPFIPWEMVKLQRRRRDGSWEAGPFLCEAYAVTRWLEGVPPEVTLPLREIGLVAPRILGTPAGAEERADVLSLRTSTRRVREVSARFDPLIAALRSGDFDGWHFIGDGSSHGEDADRWSVLLDDEQLLSPEHLAEAELFDRRRPWVFLNACYGGRGGTALVGSGGWANRFLGAGASSFIGPRWAVGGEQARFFARALYRRVLKGVPLAEAARGARLDLRDESDDDSAWLSYVVYGHPLATSVNTGDLSESEA